jgi:hypothetical protein
VVRLCELLRGRVVESLWWMSECDPDFGWQRKRTGPVSVEFDLLLHVPTISVGTGREPAACVAACAVARPAPNRPSNSPVVEDTMACRMRRKRV